MSAATRPRLGSCRRYHQQLHQQRRSISSGSLFYNTPVRGRCTSTLPRPVFFYLSLLHTFVRMTLSRPFFPPRSSSRTKSPSPFRPSIAPRAIPAVHLLPGISLSIPAIPIHSRAVSAPVSPRVSVSFSLTFPSARRIMQMLYPSLSSPDYSPLSAPLPPPRARGEPAAPRTPGCC